ncbi:MAG: DUF3408 domain-containing protein [Tannerellaceae bacterium]|jgi:hypothetical protein|nr:DUF3408 domain-containing protein [Tannerellaceae bacterium]
MPKENTFEKFRSMVHEGVPLEKSAPKPVQIESTESVAILAEPDAELSSKVLPPLTKPVEKRKRKSQGDYQSAFFTRVDFTHRKPLYITATTHRRLMRIVHLMDESKATISSYVENIIINHLETFKEDIDTIYQTNNINPTE